MLVSRKVRPPRLTLPTSAVVAFAISSLLASPVHAGEPNYARLFVGRDGCFELYDLKSNTLLVRSNPRRCAERTSPCSTFKVPLALMAFDAGILLDENSSIKWDGVKTSREAWNRDQTAASWMQNSVVWFSQRLTPQLGMAKVKNYLKRFDYGNRDMSGGLTRAWLESSLAISPDEQLRFWQRFWREELPVTKHAFAMTKRITLVETSPAGWALHGKTGSGAVGTGGADEKSKLWLGWFVGHIANGDREYLFVASYTDLAVPEDDRPSGWIARDIAKEILKELGLY
jgi:beta-lactamase class D